METRYGKKRSISLDILKGIAIIAISLYHVGGILPYGYLGVDIFLVVSGYLLITGSICVHAIDHAEDKVLASING